MKGTPLSAVSRWDEGGGTVTRCHFLRDTDTVEVVQAEGLQGVMGTRLQFPPKEASAHLRLQLKLRPRPSTFPPAPNPNRKSHLLRGRAKERSAALSRTSRARRQTARSSPRRRGRCLRDSWIPRSWPRRFWKRPRATCRLWRACRKQTEGRNRGELRGERRHASGSLLSRLPQPPL